MSENIQDKINHHKKFCNVLGEIHRINYDKHYFSFKTYYFWDLHSAREKKDKKFFTQQLLDNRLNIHYNPWREDKLLNAVFEKYNRKCKEARRATRFKGRGIRRWESNAARVQHILHYLSAWIFN
jgi:hypothetical protein